MRRALLALVLVGCGAAQPRPVASSAEPVSAEESAVDTEVYAQVSAFFSRKRPHVTQCYNNAFADVEPKKRGKGYVTVSLKVLPNGKADDVRIASSTLRSDSVEQCLVGMIARWSLPRPADPMLFTYSYDFNPE